MDKEILIEKYLAGDASNEELLALKQLLKEDEALKHDVAVQRLMKGVVKAAEKRQFMAQIKQLSEEVLQPQLGKDDQKEDTTREKAKVRSLFPPKWAMAVAAAITLLLVSVFVFNQQVDPTEALYAEYYQPFSAKNVRGASASELQTSMVTAYNLADYQQAKALLQQLIAEQSTNTERYTLLLANCQLNLGEHTQAIELLQSLSQSESEYQEDAQWYLVMTYLKANQLEEAKVLIQQIQQNPNHLYFSKSKEIGDQL